MKSIHITPIALLSFLILSASRAADFSFDSGSHFDPNVPPLGTSTDPFEFGVLAADSNSFSVLEQIYFSNTAQNNPFSNVFSFSLASDTSVTISVTAGLHVDAIEWPMSLLVLLSDGGNLGTPLDYGTQGVAVGTLPAGNYSLIVYAVAPPNPPNYTAYYSETYTGNISASVVPEPSSVILLVSGTAFFMLRRTLRRHERNA